MYDINYEEMGARIRAKRKELGLTQEKLAERVEISTSHIGEIERGTSICSLAVIVNIATELGLNLDILVKGIDDKNANNAFSEIIDGLPKDNQKLYIRICENLADSLK